MNLTNAIPKILEKSGSGSRYLLRLFVAGMTPRSTAAIVIVKSVCERHLPGRYDLEVIDIYRCPSQASEEQIIAVPMLVNILPSPMRRLIGNLSDEVRVLSWLKLISTE